MGARILPAMILMLGGSSLTTGRLATPPISWALRLQADMEGSPECVGEVRIINTGQGSSTSVYGAGEAELKAPLRPTHVLMEDWGINDCVPANGIPLIFQRGNLYTMFDAYLAANPDVIIVHQTMSSASAGDVNRTNLAAYYANGTAAADLYGLLTLDHYANWPKPLPLADTVDMDGLHPTWEAFEQYSYPAILLWARAAMAAYWGVSSPYTLLTQDSDPLLTQNGLFLEVEH